ncbi:c-type cytochrome [Thiomicrorhabdus aquaedulcis]|uniref:c-type cytochrome n=1 Tax=Thiomicrorhabdus aquaedulcis TaxID=2211106 RepID=UPI000FD84D8F|nr:cytochrome c [Thiomicrorhabdus aquaedulcis]
MSQMPEIRKNLNRLHCGRVVKHNTQTRSFQSHAPWALSTLCAALLLSGCGGGGSSNDPVTDPVVPLPTTASISGTVPGTLIEAFCANGAYYKVSSTNNGTAQHPFTLNLPSNLDCRLVMTTNETDVNNRVITPLSFTSTESSGLFTLQSAANLGYVPLEMNRNNIIDANNDGVTDAPLAVPSAAGMTVKAVSFDLLDTNGDGIPNVYEDDDNDGRFNREDDDDDGDGTNDEDEDDDHDSDDDGIDDDYDADDHPTTVVAASVQNYTLSTGRLLVSQCAQCHGTNGRSVTGWDSITDEGDELAREILDDAAIMTAQAHGYTAAEIAAMSSWLMAQPSSSGDDGDDDDNDDNDD